MRPVSIRHREYYSFDVQILMPHHRLGSTVYNSLALGYTTCLGAHLSSCLCSVEGKDFLNRNPAIDLPMHVRPSFGASIS
jgi:hypothetical protein